VHDVEIEVGGSAEIGNAAIGSTTLSRATNSRISDLANTKIDLDTNHFNFM